MLQIYMSSDVCYWNDFKVEQSRKRSLQREVQKVLREECRCSLNQEQMKIMRERKERSKAYQSKRREKMVMTILECRMRIGTFTDKFRRMDTQKMKSKTKLILESLRIKSQIWILNSSFYFTALKRCQQQRISSLDYGPISIAALRYFSSLLSWDQRVKVSVKYQRTCLIHSGDQEKDIKKV